MLKWLMLLFYIASGTYILWRLIHWLKIIAPIFKNKIAQGFWIGLYCIFASTLFLGAFLPKSEAQAVFRAIGNIWLCIYIYMITFIVISDIVVLILKKIDKERKLLVFRKLRISSFILGIIGILFSAGLTGYGYFHAKSIKVNEYDITVKREVSGLEELEVVLLSDLHMGFNLGSHQMRKIVDMVNEMNPDLILIAGDIFDNKYEDIDDPEEIIKTLQELHPVYGSYAIFGNHDVVETLVGGFSTTEIEEALCDERMVDFLERANITLLRDEFTTIVDGKINLIGRLDGRKSGNADNSRMDFDELISQCDMSKPVFVMNHEPEELQMYADKGVDVLFSGHTHAGQFFPLTLVQPFVWENVCGLKLKDKLSSIVTSGLGVYGPAIRVGTSSEILKLHITFE